MTEELPGRKERDLADALDAALDRGSSAPGSPENELAGLAGALRAALPLPALPTEGRAEVRATAVAVRAGHRQRTRLAVAAVITLLAGATGGAALSNAVSQPSAVAARLDLAAVEHNLTEARKVLSGHPSPSQKAKADQELAKADQEITAAAKSIEPQSPPTTTPAPVSNGPNGAVEGQLKQIQQLTEELAALKAQNAKLQREYIAARAATSTTGGPSTTASSTTASSSAGTTTAPPAVRSPTVPTTPVPSTTVPTTVVNVGGRLTGPTSTTTTSTTTTTTPAPSTTLVNVGGRLPGGSTTTTTVPETTTTTPPITRVMPTVPVPVPESSTTQSGTTSLSSAIATITVPAD
jgi:hypothetical protein